MKAGIKKAKNVLGFTLVELMIVIGVISVLVTIVSFSYRGAQHSSAVATVKSDLTQAGTKIKTEKLNGVSGTYPTTVPSSVKISDNVVLQVTVAADNSGFCVDGSHQRYDDIRYYYSSDQGLGEGQCSGLTAYVPPEESQPGTVPQTAPIVSASGVTTTTASFSWTAVEGALGYSGQWRVNGGAWTLADFESAMSTPIGTQPAGAKIEFQARGYNDSGEGPWSSIKTVYLTMGTAPSLSVTDITSTTATYNWGNVPGATSYIFQWRQNGGSWNTVNTASTTTSMPMGPTTQGGKLEAQIAATNGGSTSPYSSIVLAQLTVDPPNWNKWNQTESYPSWTSWITRVDGAAICPAGLNLYSDYRDGIYGSYWNAWRGFTNRGTNATSTAQYVSTISNYTDTLQSQLAGYCKNEASGAVSATINSAVYTAKHVEPIIYLANPVECAGAYSGRPVYQLRLWLDEVSYNFAANQSNVNWQLYRYSTDSNWHSYDQTKTWPWSVSINGSGWSGASNSIAFKTGGAGTVEVIATGSLTVQHDANGNATIGYAGSDGPGSSIFGSASCSGAYGLGDLRP